MKIITLFLLLAVSSVTATAQSPVKKPVTAKPAGAVKPKVAVKPAVKKDTVVTVKVVAPSSHPNYPPVQKFYMPWYWMPAKNAMAGICLMMVTGILPTQTPPMVSTVCIFTHLLIQPPVL